MSVAPSSMLVRSLPRRAATAAIAVRSPSAPPYQQAATPMPPQANPGRDRYQPGAPTGSAAVPENRTATLVTVRSPRATQPAGGSTVTVGPRRLTRYSCRPSGPCAVTSALSSSPASEHHGLTPVSVTGPPRPPGPAEAVSRCGAASAANTPHVPSGGGAPASARIASASLCASSTRPTVRFCSDTAASTAHRAAVCPLPGGGSRAPYCRAKSRAQPGFSPAARLLATSGTAQPGSSVTVTEHLRGDKRVLLPGQGSLTAAVWSALTSGAGREIEHRAAG